jgi:integrase/recombinase XerD
MMIGWPQDMRTNVDWLEPEEAKALKSCVEGISRVVIHLELGLLMRRVEVIRVKCENFGGACMNVLGKGKNGGKWRTVHFSKDTREIIGEWLLERRKIVARAKEKNPTVSDPGNLLIYERGGELHEYGDTAIDKIVSGTRKKLEELYGRAFTFSNHTLRRTGGRMMFGAKVPIATISNIMGHESVTQTIKYLGINLDDQADAFDLVSQYEKGLSAPQRGFLTPEPVSVSGPKEI